VGFGVQRYIAGYKFSTILHSTFGGSFIGLVSTNSGVGGVCGGCIEAEGRVVIHWIVQLVLDFGGSSRLYSVLRTPYIVASSSWAVGGCFQLGFAGAAAGV
jgi:hypothetical protein